MELKDFIEKFEEQFDNIIAPLSADTKFKNLNDWSSLIALSIIAMVDEEYGVTIGGEDIRVSSTIGDLFERIKNK